MPFEETEFFMNIKIPQPAEYILHTLERCGYEAYTVGGCVRDSLLGRSPHDWDICTSATPSQIIAAFPNKDIIPTGLQHGTVTIAFHHVPYEITTYRIDGTYSDNRRPDSVSFTTSLEEDLQRRDFTINAMAYSDTRGLADPYRGQQDLTDQVIRCVGNADERFNEDGLRILRALRFSAQLGFSIEKETSDSVHRNRRLLDNIAQERIHAELEKALASSHPAFLFSSYRDVAAQIIPELEACFDFQQNSPYHIYDVWTHTLKALEHTSQDLVVRWAILFHDIGKPACYFEDEKGVGHFKGHDKKSAEMADAIMRRMKFDKYTRDNAKELIYYHDVSIQPTEKDIKKWLNRIGEEQFRRLLEVKRADRMAHAPQYIEDGLSSFDQIELILNHVLEDNQCFSIKDLAVTGKDLIKIGYKPGVVLGAQLNILLDQVISGELENEKEVLIQTALKNLSTSEE